MSWAACFFIGGPIDGNTIAIEDHSCVYFVEELIGDIVFNGDKNSPMAPLEFYRHIYTRVNANTFKLSKHA